MPRWKWLRVMPAADNRRCLLISGTSARPDGSSAITLHQFHDRLKRAAWHLERLCDHVTARRTLRSGCEELAARAAEDNAADGSAAPGQKPPRWSAERRASRVMGRRAPRKRLACRVTCGPNGCSAQHPCACRRSAHPSSGWAQVHKPGRIAPRERDGLFDK
jgi:hypothetical protein